MNFANKLLILILVAVCPFANSQTIFKGNNSSRGNIEIGTAMPANASFFAALPVSWVNTGLTTGTGVCPTSGFDATKTIPGDYAATMAGIIQAKTDQLAANQHWLVEVTAGTNIHSSTYDGNNALLSMPTNGGVTKCFRIRSSSHNTTGETVCSDVHPISRDFNCASDAAKFWKFTIDSVPVAGYTGLLFPYGSNYNVIEDMELTITPGATQSQAGVKSPIFFEDHGDHNLVAYSWIHGWDPGDAGQPGIGSGNAAVDNVTGACLAWNHTAIVNTSGTTVTYVSGDRFGMDISDGTNSSGYPQATVLINGLPYIVAIHDPVSTDSTFTTTLSVGTQTNATMTWQNPKTGYTTGCGDDSRGVQLNGTNFGFLFNYVNKIHLWNSESHSVSTGFGVGPGKIAHNFIECGSSCFFSGGGSIMTRGGPIANLEVRGNIFLGDLNRRFLTGGATNSPHPPFGAGPLAAPASRSTAPFAWAIKNVIECKFCSHVLFDGNIVRGVWADGQSGYLMLMTIRSDSSGYDPDTGLPYPSIDNVRVSNNWFGDAPQVFQFSTRSLGSGNGVGISMPLRNFDIINNAIVNVKDTNQFGSPGSDLAQWAASGQIFSATVSRTGGVAHAVLAPMKVANFDPATTPINAGTYRNAFDVTSVTSVGDVVTMVTSDQWSYTVGGQVTVSNTTGWNGTFTISGVKNGASTTPCSTDVFGNSVAASRAVQPQLCIRADGTFGTTLIYTDSINHPGGATLCTSLATCDATGIHAVSDSLDFKVSAMSVGDGVYAFNCSDASLETGATSFTSAIAPTSPTGLDVYYINAGADTSGVTCYIENSAGLPMNVTYQYNTDLATGINSIDSNGLEGQHRSNYVIHNIFGMPTGNNAVLTDADVGGQGTAVFAAWDSTTFQFLDNVLQGRTNGQWSVVPGGSPVNFFPTDVGCSGATATSTCLGLSGFMSGSAFPTTPCTYDGSNPLNCRLMAAPWSSNFALSQLVPVASSSYLIQGASIPAIEDAITRTQYVCPIGAAVTCTPYSD